TASQLDLLDKLGYRYGEFEAKENFDETLISFCEKNGASRQDVEREAALSSRSVGDMAKIMAQRALKGFSPSVTVAIQKAWADAHLSQDRTPSLRQVGHSWVLINPHTAAAGGQSALVVNSFLAEGGVKRVFSASMVQENAAEWEAG